MNEKYTHIDQDTKNGFPSPEIPEDRAWEEMRKLLEDDDDKIIPPLPPSGSPAGNKGYWKFGLLLVLITGTLLVMNRNKINSRRNNGELEKTAKPSINNSKKPAETTGRSGETSDESTRHEIKKLSAGDYDADSSVVAKTQSEKRDGLTTSLNKNARPTVIADNSNPKNKTQRISWVKMDGIGYNHGNPIQKNNYKNKTQITGHIGRTGKKIEGTVAPESKPTRSISKTGELAAEQDKKESAGSQTTLNKTTVTASGDTLNAIASKAIDSSKNKSNTSKNSNDEKKEKKRIALAAGLGLNQFFTVGSQQHSSYNSSGITGALSDYIPIPFVKWYLNKKAYVQIEAQINTPQFTKKLLAKSEVTYDTAGPILTTTQSTVFINKLFYFNLPLSIHYNLFDHFYLGAGIQFSRLTNGVGQFDGKQYNSQSADTTSDFKIANLKTDPVYKEIKTNEWRILFDLNYQWKNLGIGMRYNQALSNFIHVQVSSTQLTQARNSSIQLYLRYILWKNGKTKELLSGK